MARRSSQQSLGFEPWASSMSVVSVRRRSASRTTLEVYNARRSNPGSQMPLPKSILCKACKKTYPEGWRRCPYCGNDELGGRQEAPGRRLMQQRVREWEQRFGKREERADKNRPRDSRGAAARPRQDGSRPRQQQVAASRPPTVQPAERPAGRRRRRRGGRRGEGATAHPPQQKPQVGQSPQAQRRPNPRPAQQPSRRPNPRTTAVPQESSPERPAGMASEGDGGRRRRRFRRRRRGGEGGGAPQPPRQNS